MDLKTDIHQQPDSEVTEAPASTEVAVVAEAKFEIWKIVPNGVTPEGTNRILWDDYADEWLIKFTNQGLSASRIAGLLRNISRNAVIGRQHRLKDAGRLVISPFKNRGVKMTAAGKANAQRKRKDKTLQRMKSEKQKIGDKSLLVERLDAQQAQPRVSSDEVHTANIAFADEAGRELVDRMKNEFIPTPRIRIPGPDQPDVPMHKGCRYIHGDPLGDYSYCPHSRVEPSPGGSRMPDRLSPYCAEHKALSYQPRSSTTRVHWKHKAPLRLANYYNTPSGGKSAIIEVGPEIPTNKLFTN